MLEKKKREKKVPLKEGYQPTEDKIDTSNPPKGGSGVPNKNTKD